MKKLVLIISLAALFLGVNEGINIIENTELEKQNLILRQNIADWGEEQVLFLSPDLAEITVVSYDELGLDILLDDDNNLCGLITRSSLIMALSQQFLEEEE